MDCIIKTGKRVSLKAVNDIRVSVKWPAVSAEKWRVIQKQSTFMVQVFIGKKMVGFARCVDDAEICMIYDVMVHAAYQGQGIGTIVMREILKYVRSYPFYSARLFYDSDYPTLVNFYRKFGFELMQNAMKLTK